jgi:hypothetical protein
MAKPKSNPALRLALIRQLHVYVSVFIAPSLMFFAITGAFQTFRIPDRPDAPVLLQKLARAHRDDVFAVKPPPPPKKIDAGSQKTPSAPKPAPKPAAATTAVKAFFVLVSIGAVFSIGLGVWMALAYNRRKRLMWALLLAGALAPAILLAL